ncbi:hypothetical protein EYZ11_011708 [Aspergillus tanneri]|uniref:Xylanolytic transcriptional activator regulatory domain-containing protein n=1 Tax=Aspergillus tanneri TaxID=1220188 RepID=A0A4S3J496_9EURO|nr:hypothetical protein EYZ11_011708 [Aspergillus tanneri]
MYLSPTSAGRSDEDSTELRKKRTARACDACYKRKIKCDAAAPQCCITINSVDSNVPRRPLKSTRLAERIERIEKLLTDNLLKENGREFGVVSLMTGIPFLLPEGRQWVQSRTGQTISFDKLSPSRPPWEKQRAISSNELLMSLRTQNIFHLPDRRIVELRFDAYCNSLMQRVFPVLDRVLFWDTIKVAYQNLDQNAHCTRAGVRACVFAFLAFSIAIDPCLNTDGTDLPSIDGEECALKAQHLLPQILQENPSVEGIQALTMLALCELVSGNLQAANYHGSLAARMIFMIGANAPPSQPTGVLEPHKDFDARVQRQLRNVFWVCYTMEKDVCFRTGQPQLFTEENCDLTMPPGYVEKLYSSMEYHHHSREFPESPLFPVDLRLSIIKSRAYSVLYSLKALKKTDAELLKEIREMDDDLERWRISVPPEWRPTLSFSHETPDPNGGMMDGVSSSLALSVEASRSTLLYLEAAAHVLVDGIFWTLIFYPMSAVLAIFCNILQNPSDPQATKDLGLLKTATTMMDRIFLKQPYSVTEIVHIKRVADFVTELYRLAACAIEKAWKERSG